MLKELSILKRFQESTQETEAATTNVQEKATPMQQTTEDVEERVNVFTKNNRPVEEKETISRVQDTTSYPEDVINKNPRMRIYTPTHYDIVTAIGTDLVRDKKIVILNMTKLDDKTTIKILQFVSGICFTMNIEPEDIADKIISIDPTNQIK